MEQNKIMYNQTTVSQSTSCRLRGGLCGASYGAVSRQHVRQQKHSEISYATLYKPIVTGYRLLFVGMSILFLPFELVFVILST